MVPLSVFLSSMINDGHSSIFMTQLLILNYSLIDTEINSIKVLRTCRKLIQNFNLLLSCTANFAQ